MSITLMSEVWQIDLPASEKLVLLALADCANDEGGCWPSMATLAKKCSKGERTVQAALNSLEKNGHITRDQRPGKGCYYTVHPQRAGKPLAKHHYVYRVTRPDTGEYYIGARSSLCEPADDPYLGSGIWIKEQVALGVKLIKEVIETFDSRDALAVGEQAHTAEHFGLELCRNAKVASPGTLSRQKGDTPAIFAGRKSCGAQKRAPTPAKSAPHPRKSRTQTIIEPSGTVKPTEARAHELPDDWHPEEFGAASKCRKIVDGWPPDELETQIEHFIAHHRSRGNKFKDWQDVWKTWVIGSRRFERGDRQGRTRSAGPRDNRDGFERALDRRIEARHAAGRSGPGSDDGPRQLPLAAPSPMR